MSHVRGCGISTGQRPSVCGRSQLFPDSVGGLRTEDASEEVKEAGD